jgi:hypothetical protein
MRPLHNGKACAEPYGTKGRKNLKISIIIDNIYKLKNINNNK